MVNGSNVTTFSTGAKHKPVLDEAGFEQLLAAAFVLQQHNDTLRASNPNADPLAVLSKLTVVDATAAEDAKRPVREAPLPPVQEILQLHELTRCPVCARQLGAGEEFCGGCGARRPSETVPGDLQGKWASLWYMSQAQYVFPEKDFFAQETHRPEGPRLPEDVAAPDVAERIETPVENKLAEAVRIDSNSTDIFVPASVEPVTALHEKSKLTEAASESESAREPSAILNEPPTEREFRVDPRGTPLTQNLIAENELATENKSQPAEERAMEREAGIDKAAEEIPSEPWSDGLPEIGSQYRQDLWRRVNASSENPVIEVQVDNEETEYSNYDPQENADPSAAEVLWSKAKSSVTKTMGLAICAITLLIALWVFRPNPSSQSPHSRLQSLLVQLGLAQSSPHSAYAGNPNTRVWVDVHTALYYCPGSELYGKTPGGRFSKQRSAQEDEFEPSTNIPCD